MFLKYNIFTILWAILLLFMVLIPGDLLPDSKSGSFTGLDKLVHVFFFSILILLMIVGFSKQYEYQKLRYNAVGFSLGISVIYGLIMESAQSLVPGRNVELLDVVANTSGCLIGIGLFYLFNHSLGEKEK